MKTKSHEDRDFVRVVEDLEVEQQHDLSVHLYLLFLLHHVNPYFPQEHWSSWPLPQERAVDPRIQSRYEDTMVDNLFRDFQDGTVWSSCTSVAKKPPFDESVEQAIFAFQRSGNSVTVSHKRVYGSNPKATLANEMHAAVQRAIFRKALKLVKPGQKVVVEESALTRNMALQLANRLDKVFTTLGTQSRRRAFYKRTWQDVLIASVRSSGYGEVCNVESHKTAYTRASELFMNPQYKYEYDPEGYTDTVPEFDLEHHIASIEEETNVRYPKSRPPLEYLERLAKESEMKDHIFGTLLRQATNGRLLSWKESDILDYEVAEDNLSEEVQALFADRGMALRPSDFGYS